MDVVIMKAMSQSRYFGLYQVGALIIEQLLPKYVQSTSSVYCKTTR